MADMMVGDWEDLARKAAEAPEDGEWHPIDEFQMRTTGHPTRPYANAYICWFEGLCTPEEFAAAFKRNDGISYVR